MGPDRWRGACVFAVVLIAVSSVGAQQKRLITVEDCVRTRRILREGLGSSSPVQLSQDGFRVAYVVKSPNVETNRNDYQLYVRDLRQHERRESGRLLLQSDRITGVKWIGGGRLVALVTSESTKASGNEFEIVNTTTGMVTKLAFPVPVEDFSISADGRVVAFSALVKLNATPSEQSRRETRDERGYPVIFGKGSGDDNDGVPQ